MNQENGILPAFFGPRFILLCRAEALAVRLDEAVRNPAVSLEAVDLLGDEYCAVLRKLKMLNMAACRRSGIA